MGLKEMLQNVFNRNDRVKEIVAERRAQRIAEQREKPSNERELERFYEEKRQALIKSELEKFRKQRQKENWKSHLLKKEYMFKDKKPILKERNIFKNNRAFIFDNYGDFA